MTRPTSNPNSRNPELAAEFEVREDAVRRAAGAEPPGGSMVELLAGLQRADARASEAALRQLLTSYLPSLAPSPSFHHAVLQRAAAEGAMLPWHQRGLRPPAGLLARSRQALRGFTALAIVVIGCGLGVLGTVLGTVVTSLGLAGSAVWSSRLFLQLWTWTSEMGDLVFATAEIARRAWLATSSGAILTVVLMCFAASSLGLLALHYLKEREGEASRWSDSEPAT